MGQQSKDRGKTTPAIMCIKILLHIYNLIYLLIGVCVLAVGAFTKIQLTQYLEISPELYYPQAPYIMIGVGALILLVAIGGFFCTAKDKVALLYLYAVFIILLAILQIGAGIAGAVLKNMIDTTFEKDLNDSLVNYDEHMPAWNFIQQKLKCCGVNSEKDWLPIYSNKLPTSCYSDNKSHPYPPGNTSPASTVVTTTKTNASSSAPSTITPKSPTTKTNSSTAASTTNKSPTATSTTTTPTTTTPTTTTPTTTTPTTTTLQSNVTDSSTAGRRRKRDIPYEMYTTGCHSKISNTITQYLGIIVGVCVGFVFLQIMGAVLACCLAKRTSKNNYEQIY